MNSLLEQRQFEATWIGKYSCNLVNSLSRMCWTVGRKNCLQDSYTCEMKDCRMNNFQNIGTRCDCKVVVLLVEYYKSNI